MQTVIVTPDDIAFAHETVLPILEDFDGAVTFSAVPTNEELVELGGEATVVVTGDAKSVAAFVTGLSLYTRFPRLDDPTLCDMRGFGDRQQELIENVEVEEDGSLRFEVKVTPRITKVSNAA